LVALSYQSDTFDEELVLALQTIADQVGVAIDSIRLSNESEATSERLRKAYGELSRRAWQEALGTRAGYGYEARTTGVEALDATPPDHWDDGLRQAWQRDRVVSETREEDYGVQTQTLAIPVRARGEVIGVLDVAKLAEKGAWTALEREQLSGLADQLGQALENARLYEVTQRSALEQEMIGQATRRMRETLSVDTVLQTAVRELQGLLDLEAVEIRVGPTNGEPGAGNGAGGEGMSDDD
jgi:GAF domain-containing protein